MKSSADFSRFDSRLLERKIKSGEISQEEYDKWLAELPDSSEYLEIDEDHITADAAADNEETSDEETSDDETEADE